MVTITMVYSGPLPHTATSVLPPSQLRHSLPLPGPMSTTSSHLQHYQLQLRMSAMPDKLVPFLPWPRLSIIPHQLLPKLATTPGPQQWSLYQPFRAMSVQLSQHRVGRLQHALSTAPQNWDLCVTLINSTEVSENPCLNTIYGSQDQGHVIYPLLNSLPWRQNSLPWRQQQI